MALAAILYASHQKSITYSMIPKEYNIISTLNSYMHTIIHNNYVVHVPVEVKWLVCL